MLKPPSLRLRGFQKPNHNNHYDPSFRGTSIESSTDLSLLGRLCDNKSRQSQLILSYRSNAWSSCRWCLWSINRNNSRTPQSTTRSDRQGDHRENLSALIHRSNLLILPIECPNQLGSQNPVRLECWVIVPIVPILKTDPILGMCAIDRHERNFINGWACRHQKAGRQKIFSQH